MIRRISLLAKRNHGRRPERRALAAVALVVAYVACRGLLLAGVVPPWQGPDEPGHVEYAVLMARQRGVPLEPDRVLQAAILRSMTAHRFYSHANAPAPTAMPSGFDDVERLRDAPTQLGNETPVGYLPFAAVAALGGTGDVAAALGRMRLVSVALVAATVLLAGAAAWESLGRRWAPAAAGVVAAAPMLGFAGAVVNTDGAATTLGTLWFALLARAHRRGIGWRPVAALVLLAGLAASAKRSALFLIPLAVLVAILSARRTGLAVAASEGIVKRDRRRVWAWVACLAAGGLVGATVARRPVADRAAGWDRVGARWQAERSPDAARTGRFGLRVADASHQHWQYLEQWVPLAGGRDVHATAWLRATPGGAGGRAQLVVNDDFGVWMGETVALAPTWRAVSVSGRVSKGAGRVRVALVPGQGTAAGTGAFDADDIALTVLAPAPPVIPRSGGDAATVSRAADGRGLSAAGGPNVLRNGAAAVGNRDRGDDRALHRRRADHKLGARRSGRPRGQRAARVAGPGVHVAHVLGRVRMAGAVAGAGVRWVDAGDHAVRRRGRGHGGGGAGMAFER